MADVEFTPGAPCFRGKLGNLQYRKIRGKYVVSPVPDFSDIQWSKAQLHHRDTMKESARWGRQAFEDPAIKADFEARARELDVPVYALVYRDYWHGPTVDEIDLAGYTGKAGQEIRVRVDDPFEGFQVDLALSDLAGRPLETGAAARTAVDQITWVYHTTMNLESLPAILVEAVAKDRPGNRGHRLERLTLVNP